MKLAVIGANEPSIPFYKQAKKLGYTIIGIAYEKGAVCKEYCDKFYPISFADKDDVLRVCMEEKIDGITSFSLESALPTVIYVAQKMGLVSNDYECLEHTKNKFVQREAFKNCGLLVPKYFKTSRLESFDGYGLCFPIIVKPVDSGGSQGVVKLDNIDGYENALTNAIEISRTGEAIVEEYIEGREFSVEYLSFEGIHYFIQITDKVTSGSPNFIEMQHHQPANLDSECVNIIKNIVEKALTSLKITNSPSHTEIKMNSKGEFYIIEIGARMGGDFITSDLVRLSTGYDMVKGAIEIATNTFKKPNISNKYFSGVYFYSELAPHVGDVIKNKDNYPEIVECELKDIPLPKAKSNADRAGYLLYQSDKKVVL